MFLLNVNVYCLLKTSFKFATSSPHSRSSWPWPTDLQCVWVQILMVDNNSMKFGVPTIKSSNLVFKLDFNFQGHGDDLWPTDLENVFIEWF